VNQKASVIAVCVIGLMFGNSVVAESDSVTAQLDIPVPADEGQIYLFEILSESDYTDERGRTVIDVIEGYDVNLALSVDTLLGQPVIGLEPEFELKGSSELVPPGRSTPLETTDESGVLEFGVTAGRKGLDQLKVSFGGNEAIVYFNIISLAINDFPSAPILENGLKWSELMQADIEFEEGEVKVTYSEAIVGQAGQNVRVSGFLMPLEAGIKQRRFLFTSSPPHCFFHIPGGPAGVIEVFSKDGIETSFSPIQIQGRLELVGGFGNGIIYQIRDAELIEI